MRAARYLPDAGDLIWTDFDPTRGREQAGRRPALVLSSAAFTENTGLAGLCPITSRVRPFPTSVVLPPGLPVAGEILTSHIRSIDTQARPVRYAGAAVPAATAHVVRAAERAHHDLSAAAITGRGSGPSAASAARRRSRSSCR